MRNHLNNKTGELVYPDGTTHTIEGYLFSKNAQEEPKASDSASAPLHASQPLQVQQPIQA